MREELDSALCEKFPLIFKNRYASAQSTAMCWGFECGDGWYDLLESTCELLYWPYQQAVEAYEQERLEEGTVPYPGADLVTAVDVERKRLLMAEAARKIPVAMQVKEKYGTLRFYVSGGDERAQAILEFAEYHSSKVCEICGARGQVRGEGWLTTRCEAHAGT